MSHSAFLSSCSLLREVLHLDTDLLVRLALRGGFRLLLIFASAGLRLLLTLFLGLLLDYLKISLLFFWRRLGLIEGRVSLCLCLWFNLLSLGRSRLRLGSGGLLLLSVLLGTSLLNGDVFHVCATFSMPFLELPLASLALSVAFCFVVVPL